MASVADTGGAVSIFRESEGHAARGGKWPCALATGADAGAGLVRIVHDTTTCRFLGDREGLCVPRVGAKGFLAHVALAVAVDETPDPLGVVGVRPYIHQDAVTRAALTMSGRRAQRTRGRTCQHLCRTRQTSPM